MTLSCENLKGLVQSFSLVQQCDVVKNGALRIATPFNYPNGSQIDLFLEHTNNLFGGYLLSDGGQTADYVADMHFKLWATKKRRILIDDICNLLQVGQSAGGFEIHLEPQQLNELPQAIVRLAQACIRIADLIFTQRLQNTGTFQEEVEEFIALNDLPYEPDIYLIGAFNKEVKVDFRVHGQKVTSLIQTLSTRTNAHPLSNEIFRRWYDLQPYRVNNQFITIYDETSNVFRDDDLQRLNDFSLVLGFPNDQEQIYEAIAA